MNQRYEIPITVIKRSLLLYRRLRPIEISPQGLIRKVFLAPEEGTLGIPKLVQVPIIAVTTTRMPIHPILSFHMPKIIPQIAVPIIMARNVLISKRPLALERSLSGSISGIIPYLAGLTKVECMAIRKRTTSIKSLRPDDNAKIAIPMAT